MQVQLNTIFLLLLFSSVTSSLVKQRPYIWKHHQHKEFISTRLVDIWIEIEEPCVIFEDVKFFSYNTHKCLEEAEKKVYQPLSELCAIKQIPDHKILLERGKRSPLFPFIPAIALTMSEAASIAMIFCTVLTGISTYVSTIYTRYKENQVRKELDDLRSKQNETLFKIIQKIEDEKRMWQRVEKTLSKAIFEHELINTKMEIQNFMDTANMIINYEKDKWKQNRYDMLLLDLLNISNKIPNNETLISYQNCHFDREKKRLYLEAELSVEDQDVLTFQIDPFIIFHKVDNKICDYQYQGPKYAKIRQNNNSLCLTDQLQTNICISNSSIYHFIKRNCFEDLTPDQLIQIKENEEYFIVYCPWSLISISGKQYECPQHPIQISKTETFKLKGMHYIGRNLEIKQKISMYKHYEQRINQQIPENIIPVTPDDFGMQKRSNFANLILIFVPLIFVIIACLFYFILKMNAINQFAPPTENPININH